MSRRNTRTEPRTRRKWTNEEDAALLELTRRFGLDDWRSISAHMVDRDPKQCRERYINHLDPNVKKDKLTVREWKILLCAHDVHGNKCAHVPSLLTSPFALFPLAFSNFS